MPAIDTAVELLDEYASGVRHFPHSNLRDAYLPSIHLVAADLSWGCLTSAHLAKANLWRANLDWANLVAADLSGAQLVGANLNWANLSQACLVGTDLDRANLEWSNLVGTDLRAVNLERAELTDACYSSQTIFPDGFDPVAAGMIQVDVTVPPSGTSSNTMH